MFSLCISNGGLYMRSSYVREFIIIVGLGICERSGVARDFQSNHEKRQKKTTDFALKELNRQ